MIYLILVLPFPFAFVIHEVEEVVVQHRWMQAHGEALAERFPRFRAVIEHLARLDTKAFSIAALEELVALLLITAYVLVQGRFALWVWSAAFMAFTFHLLVHIGQGIAVRGYVPGLATSLMLSPFAAYGVWSIWLVMGGVEMLSCLVAGVVFMAINLRFAHWLGMRLS